MSNLAIGRLARVDVRACWQNEAMHFTPWLTEEENITLLADALGLPGLEVEATEVGVGPYRADILCRQAGSDELVLIENQLGCTDHKHLGQIVTYAAGLEATKVVWVVTEFTDEHRAALDWLNRVTGEGLHFFGVQVELWRIGDSPVAPRFQVVARPNEWADQVRATARQTMNEETRKERAVAYRDWWGGLMASLKEGGFPFRLQASDPPARNWVKVGDTPNFFDVVISRSLKENITKLYILFSDENSRRGESAADWFEFARLHQQDIEAVVEGRADFPAAGPSADYLQVSFDDGGDVRQSYLWLARAVPQLVQALRQLHSSFEADTASAYERRPAALPGLGRQDQ